METAKEHLYVVMHKNVVWNGLVFSSIFQASNAIMWGNPNKKWKKLSEGAFVCNQYGTKFEIVELIRY